MAVWSGAGRGNAHAGRDRDVGARRGRGYGADAPRDVGMMGWVKGADGLGVDVMVGQSERRAGPGRWMREQGRTGTELGQGELEQYPYLLGGRAPCESRGRSVRELVRPLVLDCTGSDRIGHDAAVSPLDCPADSTVPAGCRVVGGAVCCLLLGASGGFVDRWRCFFSGFGFWCNNLRAQRLKMVPAADDSARPDTKKSSHPGSVRSAKGKQRTTARALGPLQFYPSGAEINRSGDFLVPGSRRGKEGGILDFSIANFTNILNHSSTRRIRPGLDALS